MPPTTDSAPPLDGKPCRHHHPVALQLLVLSAALCTLSACSFRRLSSDLELMERTYLLSGMITSAADHDTDIWVVTMERRTDGEVVSADVTKTGRFGAYAFMVEGPDDHYLMAFTDTNEDDGYDPGEPAWIHSDKAGKAEAVEFEPGHTNKRVFGELSAKTMIPRDLIEEPARSTICRTTAAFLFDTSIDTRRPSHWRRRRPIRIAE
jgi:hypothetical protein